MHGWKIITIKIFLQILEWADFGLRLGSIFFHEVKCCRQISFSSFRKKKHKINFHDQQYEDFRPLKASRNWEFARAHDLIETVKHFKGFRFYSLRKLHYRACYKVFSNFIGRSSLIWRAGRVHWFKTSGEGQGEVTSRLKIITVILEGEIVN